MRRCYNWERASSNETKWGLVLQGAAPNHDASSERRVTDSKDKVLTVTTRLARIFPLIELAHRSLAGAAPRARAWRSAATSGDAPASRARSQRLGTAPLKCV